MTEKKRSIERVPASTSARKRVAGIVRDRLPEEEADVVMHELGDEMRLALSHEHEDDLERIRPMMFDLGVRTVLRVLREQDRIPVEEETRLIGMFDAYSTRERIIRAVVEGVTPYLGPGNDDATAIAQAEIVAAELRRVLP